MENTTAKIFNIQRFSVDDGPGIRTTVFFKGCPLSCIWCHNPESHSIKSELMYDSKKCISCNGCDSVCDNRVHSFDANGAHTVNHAACVACGRCVSACPTLALEIAGYDKALAEILQEALSDKAFYDRSGGGITLSGGEPLYQPKAAIALCRMAKESGIHVAVESCGFAHESVIREIAQWVDIFLLDYKAEAKDHRALTGVDQQPILNTMSLLCELGKDVMLRCPIVPDCNFTDEHFVGIGEIAKKYNNIKEVHLEPYHPLGISKAKQLGRDAKYNNGDFLDPDSLTEKVEIIKALSGKTVKIV